MNSVELLRKQSEVAFSDLCSIIEGVDQPLSWAVVPMREGEYLNSNGSILTIVQHVASCKRMYASAGFRKGELTWRTCADLYDKVGSDWNRTVADLQDAQEYWLESWSSLRDDQLEDISFRPQGDEWLLWRIISMMNYHDAYHAGQIEVLKVSLTPAATPPPSTGDDIREYCKDLPFW